MGDVEMIGHAGNYEDHLETFGEALNSHRKAVFWAVYALFVLTISSYDNSASSIFLSVPEFRKDFGYEYDNNYVLPAKWQSAYSGGPSATAVIGALSSSYISDKIGRKLAYLISFAFVLAGSVVETLATTNGFFFAGKMLNGIAVGSFGTITMTYIGEIAPLQLRGVLTAAAGIPYTFGPFIVTLLVNSYGTLQTRWAYRGIFVSQFGMTIIGLLGLPFMPESPWWLINHGKDEKAARSLGRLGEIDVTKRLAVIKLTLEQIRKESDGVTFIECFRKSNLRRTIIGIAPLSIQALSGISFTGYFSYYIQLAGHTDSFSFKLGVVMSVTAMLGNMASWLVVDRVGRRDLTIYGLIIVFSCMTIIGGLGTQTTSKTCIDAVISWMIIWVVFYNVTIGATSYNLLTEVSTARLRTKTASIGFALQNAIYTMWSFVLPYIFNPNEANLGAKTCFIFAGLTLLSLVYIWFYQPETSRRSYEELDEMFMKKIPARQFKAYRTDAEIRGEEIVQNKV
ncbi:hypothetical protein M433DRAFT_75381 [Acidomyces richmondensis BFW]|nr:MAG: hypothetical protein FE78DRAFT_141874 [Acidomyces sp. 'richmondensis']KYG41674.1 hypothetical protein M433DRAFT_75381 [Acidomyces richmondensis BFW]